MKPGPCQQLATYALALPGRPVRRVRIPLPAGLVPAPFITRGRDRWQLVAIPSPFEVPSR